MTFILVIDRIPGCKFSIKGHPFLTSTQRGQVQVDACGRGQAYVDVHTENSVFFSCKEVGIFFTRISSLDGIKSGNF